MGASWSVGDGVPEAGWAHQAGFVGQSEGFGFSSQFDRQPLAGLIRRVMWSYLYFRKINFMDCGGGRSMGTIVHQPRVIRTE